MNGCEEYFRCSTLGGCLFHVLLHFPLVKGSRRECVGQMQCFFVNEGNQTGLSLSAKANHGRLFLRKKSMMSAGFVFKTLAMVAIVANTFYLGYAANHNEPWTSFCRFEGF